jgi:hypothetical protein
MMGTKTVAQMREELRRKFSETGEDPIAWLEKRIARARAVTSERTYSNRSNASWSAVPRKNGPNPSKRPGIGMCTWPTVCLPA